jgi:hypothetical protein
MRLAGPPPIARRSDEACRSERQERPHLRRRTLVLTGLVLPLMAASVCRADVWWVSQVAAGGSATGTQSAALEQALRARGLDVLENESAARKFAQHSSRANLPPSAANMEAGEALLRKLSEEVSSEELDAAQATLAELSALPIDEQDWLDRDLSRALRRFHGCLLVARLYEREHLPVGAHQQLVACARDTPGFEPELGAAVPDEMRAFLERAQAEFSALTASSLHIEVGPGSDFGTCHARVDGIDRGPAPVWVTRVKTDQVRVEIDCDGHLGRIYEVRLAGREVSVVIDPLLDRALDWPNSLRLNYPSARAAELARVRHALGIARSVGADHILQISQGRLHRIDVAANREVGSATLSAGAIGPALEPLLRGFEPTAAVEPDREPPTSHAARPFRTAGWVAAGATALAATTAIVGGVIHENEVGKFNARPECPDPSTPTCQRLLDKANTGTAIMITAGVIGAASLVLTGVFFLADARRKPERDAQVWTCDGGPGLLGILCARSF